MGRVKVNRISGVTDPLTGMPAKQIELVEVRDSRRPEMFPASDEARVVQGMVSQLQSMGLMPQIRDLGYSKVTMTLTESEYDMLGMRLDVNEIYELDIRSGSLTLRKVTEGT
ncbi:MAG TPA: arcadin 1 [Nitrososphaerales archaeon]|nr:arcadin 1 [Nitrososphaerales archaeon]